MENAVEALKMAFAFLAFVLALTVSVIAFSNVKATSDVILYSKDETNYYDYIKDNNVSGRASENRVVGLETIIPTLYKYYLERRIIMKPQESFQILSLLLYIKHLQELKHQQVYNYGEKTTIQLCKINILHILMEDIKKV